MKDKKRNDVRFLVYGSVNIDMVFSVPHIARGGETLASRSLQKNAGGKGANQAASLAKAGLDVIFAGKIGRDGEWILEILQQYGVDTSGIVTYDGSTGQAVIQVDENGENSIVLFSGGNNQVTKQEIDSTLGCFERGDYLLLQNEISNVSNLIKRGSNIGMHVCFNPSPCSENVMSYPLELVDTFFVNEIEGRFLAGLAEDAPCKEILQTMDRLYPKAEIILTGGKAGAWYSFNGNYETAAALNVPVTDTTGAGDTFTGYFLSARKQGMSVKLSLETACRASSLTVSRPGAMQSIPTADEVFVLEKIK